MVRLIIATIVACFVASFVGFNLMHDTEEYLLAGAMAGLAAFLGSVSASLSRQAGNQERLVNARG
jgi:hypothetical protein